MIIKIILSFIISHHTANTSKLFVLEGSLKQLSIFSAMIIGRNCIIDHDTSI